MDLLHLEGPLGDIPDVAFLQPDLEQISVPIWHPDGSAPVGAEPLSNALDKCERDIAKIMKSIATTEDEFFCRVAPFLETTPIPMSVDAAVILGGGSGILEAMTSVSLGSPIPVLSETHDVVSTDANAVRGGGPSDVPVSSSMEGEVATVLA